MLLEGDQLSFRYPDGAVLFKDVSIRIRAGEVVGLIGPSGCGKTTLARMLSGYDHPLTGEIKLDGKPLPSKGYHPVQLVFQHPEKAVNPRWKMHRIVNEGWKVEEKLLFELGIESRWLNRWPHELSAGELQRFCVARALGPLTRFLIADEMTAMLDAITQAQIWNVVLATVRERKLGLLVISHDESLLERLCTRILTWSSIANHPV